MVAHNPLNRSGRAELPHPALASGNDAKAVQRIGVIDAGRGQPASNQPSHAVPPHSTSMATTRQRAMPEPAGLEAEQVERRSVHGHSVIPGVSFDYRAQPLAHSRDGVVHTPLEFGFHLTQLGLQSLAYGLPKHREPSVTSLLPADMCEAEEVEGLGLSLATPRSVFGRERAELQEAGLLGMQFQAELAQSLAEFLPEPLGIRAVLESEHDIVGKPDNNHVTARLLVTPYPDPQVEHVVEIEVGEQWRCTTALWRPLLHPRPLALLQHARVQPFLDESHNALVRNPVLDKLHQPAVVDGIKESTDVQVEHPVHLSRQQSGVERIQRVMRAASRPKAVREAEEVSFVDDVEHLDRGALEQLIFQRRHSERPLPSVWLRDEHSTHWLGSVGPALDPLSEVTEVFLQSLAIVSPRLTVDARGGFPLQAEVGSPQRGQSVDMVQERGEPHLPIPGCCQAYPLQRTGRDLPALSPGRVLLEQIPFGQSPSLRLLRRRLPGVVRSFPWYYETVRLPVLVHRRRTSLDFPTRPAAPSAAGKHRTSRFSCEVFPCVHGVSDRARLERISRYRCVRWSLPLLLTASASRRNLLSRLNTRPARTPVNASTLPLQETPHDSGPLWVAKPSAYDSFIHNTSPVYPGAQGEYEWQHQE